jgi:hypothetical protein
MLVTMIRRNQRLIASFTAMLVMAAVVFCACGAAAAQQRDVTTTSAEHTCCAPTHERPTTPTEGHEGCAHCGSLTVAPAHAADQVSDLSLAIFATAPNGAVLSGPLASADIQTGAPHSASPPDRLSLCCKLRL